MAEAASDKLATPIEVQLYRYACGDRSEYAKATVQVEILEELRFIREFLEAMKMDRSSKEAK